MSHFVLTTHGFRENNRLNFSIPLEKKVPKAKVVMLERCLLHLTNKIAVGHTRKNSISVGQVRVGHLYNPLTLPLVK